MVDFAVRVAVYQLVVVADSAEADQVAEIEVGLVAASSAVVAVVADATYHRPAALVQLVAVSCSDSFDRPFLVEPFVHQSFLAVASC